MRPINLLPPEQARAAKQRRGSALVVFIFIVFLAGIVGLWFLKTQAVAEAVDRTELQRTNNARIEASIAALSDAGAALKAYEDRSGQITDSLLVDIDWGRFMNDLGRVLPPRTWVGSLSASTSEPTQEGDNATTYGSVSFSGTAFDYPDASSWFRTLDSTEWSAVGGAWVASINQGEVGDFPVVGFSSSASLTEQALSDRVTVRVAEISE